MLGLKIDNGEMFERLLEEETIPLHDRRPVPVLHRRHHRGDERRRRLLRRDSGWRRLVEEHAHLPSDELRERVLREIAAFVGDAPQHDDMTMILLKVDDGVAGAERRPRETPSRRRCAAVRSDAVAVS